MEVSKKYIFLSVNVLIYMMLYCTAECNCASDDSLPQKSIIPRTAMVPVWTNPDYLLYADERTKRIYDLVCSILARKMVIWSDTKSISELKSISLPSAYLGINEEIVHLINVGISLLIWEQRKHTTMIILNNLLDAYFYSCDVKSMVDLSLPLETVLDNVDKNFRKLVKNLKIDRNKVVSYREELFELYLQDDLMNSIKKDEVDRFFRHSVTIESMKNMMYENPKQSEESTKILMQRARDHNEAVHQLQETNGKKVIANHVQFIASIVPYIFDYAYNHIELVVEFRKRLLGYVSKVDESTNNNITEENPLDKVYRDNKSTLDLIVGLTGFIDNLKEILLDRYFYFKEIPFNYLLENAVNKLAEFMKTQGYTPCSPIVKFYLTNQQDTSKLYNDVWELFDNVLEGLLALSGENVNVQLWKTKTRTTKIYVNSFLTQSKLLELMKLNIDNAFAAIRAFGKSLVSKDTIKLVTNNLSPKKKSDDDMQTISPQDLYDLSHSERIELLTKQESKRKEKEKKYFAGRNSPDDIDDGRRSEILQKKQEVSDSKIKIKDQIKRMFKN